MRKKKLMVGAVILLSGCSGGYFDQHPANVGPEAEAVTVVLARHQPGRGAESGLVPSVPTTHVAESLLPVASPVATTTRVASPVRSMPPALTPPMPRTMPGTTAAAPLSAPVPSGEALRPAMMQAVPSFSTRAPASPASPTENQPASEHLNPLPASQAYMLPPSEAVPTVAIQAVPQTPAAAALGPPPPAVQPGPAAPDARCEAVARQRAADAAANGLDRETQEIVRHGAFADCLAWDTTHSAPPP